MNGILLNQVVKSNINMSKDENGIDTTTQLNIVNTARIGEHQGIDMGTNTSYHDNISSHNIIIGTSNDVQEAKNSICIGNNNTLNYTSTNLVIGSHLYPDSDSPAGSITIGSYNDTNTELTHYLSNEDANSNVMAYDYPIFEIGNGANNDNRHTSLSIFNDGHIHTAAGGTFDKYLVIGKRNTEQSSYETNSNKPFLLIGDSGSVALEEGTAITVGGIGDNSTKNTFRVDYSGNIEGEGYLRIGNAYSLQGDANKILRFSANNSGNSSLALTDSSGAIATTAWVMKHVPDANSISSNSLYQLASTAWVINLLIEIIKQLHDKEYVSPRALATDLQNTIQNALISSVNSTDESSEETGGI